jgi:mRNA interferase MazF
MTAFDRWTVAVAPFPFVDNSKAKPRPVLVLTPLAWNEEHGHTLCAMITRPLETRWPSDVQIEDIAAAGLPAPSVIRCKLFTLPNDLLKRSIGVLAVPDQRNAAKVLAQALPRPEEENQTIHRVR